MITNAGVLKATIALVFESAVAQPTFCQMYADLCLHLSREVPEFPPGEGDPRPIKFKRVLLNTCQDEFEGAAEAREVRNWPRAHTLDLQPPPYCHWLHSLPAPAQLGCCLRQRPGPPNRPPTPTCQHVCDDR